MVSDPALHRWLHTELGLAFCWLLELDSLPRCAAHTLISSQGKASGNGNGKKMAKCAEQIKLENGAY